MRGPFSRDPGSRLNTDDDLWNSIKHGSCWDLRAVGTPGDSAGVKVHVWRGSVGGQDRFR